MIVKEYKAVRGSRLTDKDAVRIGMFLDQKFGDDPRTPEDVLSAARPKRSPIHRDFAWDDTVAAHAYRVEQAKYLLRSVAVVFVNGEVKPATRAYHRVAVASDEGGGGGYVPASVVWSNPEFAEQVVARAKRELEQWHDRYEEYEALAGAREKVALALAELAA